MKPEDKQKTVKLGQLKDMRIVMSSMWLEDLYDRYRGNPLVQVNLKDFVNKILEQI